jgi:hypothetical protein
VVTACMMMNNSLEYVLECEARGSGSEGGACCASTCCETSPHMCSTGHRERIARVNKLSISQLVPEVRSSACVSLSLSRNSSSVDGTGA